MNVYPVNEVKYLISEKDQVNMREMLMSPQYLVLNGCVVRTTVLIFLQANPCGI